MKVTRMGILHTAGSLYDGETKAYFRSGTPAPSGGTVALSGYHAYRSLMWCDGERLREEIGQDRVLSVAVTMTSEGNAMESAAPCAVRLYRTDLHYDAAKKGANNADTTRFDQGMTAEMPVNAHMPEYGETGLIGRGETITDSVFVTGAQAQRLVSALMAGCAIGTWDLRSGSTFSASEPPWHVRYLKEMSLTVLHEEATDVPAAPEWVRAERSQAAEGGTVKLIMGISEETEGLIKLGISSCAAGTEDWTADTEADAAACAEVPTGAGGQERVWRVCVKNAHGQSAYTTMTGSVRVLERPAAPRVKATVQCCAAGLQLEAEADAGGEAREVWMNGAPLMSLGAGETKGEKEILLREGENHLSFVLRDARGGQSAETAICLSGKCMEGRGITWRGIRSGQLGLTLKSLESRPAAAEREAGNEALVVTGKEADVETGQAKKREISAVLYTPGRESGLMRSVYCGSGELICDPAEKRFCRAVLRKARVYRPSDAGGGTEILLVFEAEPYDESTGEKEIGAEVFPLRVVNGGDVPARPLIRLTAKGEIGLKCGQGRLTVYGCDGETVIDSRTLTARDADGRLLWTEGEFPVLGVGENLLECTGNARLPRVKRREWYV